MSAVTLVIVFIGLMMLAFLYAAKVPQTVTVREVMIRLEADTSKFVEAIQNLGLSMDEAATAMGRFARAVDPGITVPLFDDETDGMTLEELIPETIDEWKRIRDG